MTKFKEVMGEYPFKPEDKRPMLLRSSDYLHYLYPPDNARTSDNNYLFVSTDTMLVGIYELAPGASFEPIDIHPGDEAYFILRGPVVQKSSHGQYVQLQENEALLMPERVWHQGNNFTNHKVRILYFIAPKAWDDEVPPKVFPSPDETKSYKGRRNDEIPSIAGRQGITLMPTTDDLGRWPVEGPPARKFPSSIYRIREDDKLITLFGTDQPTLMKFSVSTDRQHLGEIILPAGGTGPRCSDVDSHAGDAVLYCAEGPITVNLAEETEAFTMAPGDSFFVPAGTKYQLCNFDGYPVRAIFCIAPGL